MQGGMQAAANQTNNTETQSRKDIEQQRCSVCTVCRWNLEEEGEMKDGLYTRHEVACIIADLLCGTCACDYSGNDEWLPQYCDFADNVCPNTVGVACWEQYLLHKDKREDRDD